MSGEGVVALVDALLARAGNAPRAADRARQLGPQALPEALAILKARLDGRLPFHPAKAISMQVVAEAPEAMTILLSLRTGADSFQLGAVAGAMVGLAAGMGLNCSIGNLDQAGGRLELELVSVAGS
jgi:hypothetical protein